MTEFEIISYFMGKTTIFLSSFDQLEYLSDNLSQLHEEVNPELLPAALG